MSEHEKQIGQIKALMFDRHFGFIKPPAGGAGIFFHGSNCVTPFDELKVGDAVKFTIGEDQRSGRPQAFRVELCTVGE